MSLYATAVKKPVTTALVFVAIVIFGLFSLTRLSVDLLPEIETNTIMVMTSYAGASAADIEMNVSKPLENVLNSVSDLKHITSQSRENISIITLEFDYGTDIDVATNDVRDKLDVAEPMLPDDVDNPIIFKFGTNDIPIIILSVTAEESTNALYKILDDKVSNPLARISGVGAVAISGTPAREIQVYCDRTNWKHTEFQSKEYPLSSHRKTGTLQAAAWISVPTPMRSVYKVNLRMRIRWTIL